MTGIPIVNVNNNCSTGSTACIWGAQSIRGGLADCVLAWASRRCNPVRSVAAPTTANAVAAAHHGTGRDRRVGVSGGAVDVRRAGREHMRDYGATAEHFAKIGYKNHKHSVNNPYAQFQTEYSLQDIMNAPMIPIR